MSYLSLTLLHLLIFSFLGHAHGSTSSISPYHMISRLAGSSLHRLKAQFLASLSFVGVSFPSTSAVRCSYLPRYLNWKARKSYLHGFVGANSHTLLFPDALFNPHLISSKRIYLPHSPILVNASHTCSLSPLGDLARRVSGCLFSSRLGSIEI